MKETIFISHATPEDNEFTIWLCSRLEMMGYTVWVDKNQLLGGERFWKEIEHTIKTKSCKCLLVYSMHICVPGRTNTLKAGIQREMNFVAEAQAMDPSLSDFLIPLRVDNSRFDLFHGSGELNQIPFQENWATGLAQLVKKLEKDAVPKNQVEKPLLADFFQQEYLVRNGIIQKEELYLTNWWRITEGPEKLYIFRYSSEQQASAIQRANRDAVLCRQANIIGTFISTVVQANGEQLDFFEEGPAETFTLSVKDVVNGFSSASFPTQADAVNIFKHLLGMMMHLNFKRRDLSGYQLSGRKWAYFHTPKSLPTGKIRFSLPGEEKRRRKNLIGRYLTIGHWHYALSFKPVIEEVLGFSVKHHLIFTKDGYVPIDDPAVQHSCRRKKGKTMFNEEWKNLLLAFLSSMEVDGEIVLDTDTPIKVKMQKKPQVYWSSVGYREPSDTERLEALVMDIKEEEPTNEV